MSYENNNEIQTDWLKVSAVMIKFMSIGLLTAIMIAVLTVLDAQYEAIRDDGELPFRQLLIVYGVIFSLFGSIAGCVEQWLDSHK